MQRWCIADAHWHVCTTSHLCSCLCQTEALPLKVSGSIPSWLKGSYVRNGPGTFKGVKHLFDGYCMIVKFAFENGKVSTQQRYFQPDLQHWCMSAHNTFDLLGRIDAGVP